MEKTDNEQVKSRREMLYERMQGKYPDKDFSDEESLYGQIADDYDDYDKQLSDYAAREKALTDMFAKDPRSANFLMNWKNGEHPMTSLIRQFGKEGLEEIVNNEEKQDEFEQAEREYQEKVAKSKELEEQRAKNIEETNALVDEWQAKNGLTDEEVDEILALASSIADDLFIGIVKNETLDMLMRAKNYDSDIEQAASEAEVRGKNAKVEATLRKKAQGDGTANLDGKNGDGGVVARPRRDIGALERMSNNSTIWERGNEKRTRYN